MKTLKLTRTINCLFICFLIQQSVGHVYADTALLQNLQTFQ